MRLTERCEGITSAGKQCKCYATMKVNSIPYCNQHGEKAVREASDATAGTIVMGDNTKEGR